MNRGARYNAIQRPELVLKNMVSRMSESDGIARAYGHHASDNIGAGLVVPKLRGVVGE